jgi:hypothetical protein
MTIATDITRVPAIPRIDWDIRAKSGAHFTPRERVFHSILKRPDGHWEWLPNYGGPCPTFVVMAQGRRIVTTAIRAIWFVVYGEMPPKRLQPNCRFADCVNPQHWLGMGSKS